MLSTYAVNAEKSIRITFLSLRFSPATARRKAGIALEKPASVYHGRLFLSTPSGGKKAVDIPRELW
jgi:hypothetical protein